VRTFKYAKNDALRKRTEKNIMKEREETRRRKVKLSLIGEEYI
jgi:hypothetical protein